MSIHTYLDMSTTHVEQATMKLLKDHAAWRRHGWPAMTIAPYPCGCFLTTVWDETEPDALAKLPRDLERVFRYARSLGASLVRLDADGDATHHLPVYDW